MCGSEGEIVGIIDVPSLWSELETGVEGDSLVPRPLGTRLGGSGEYPLLFMCKVKTQANYTILSQERSVV